MLKKNKLAVKETIESLNKGIEKYVHEAEEKRYFKLLSKANTFRNLVKDKQQMLTNLTNSQKKYEEELTLV